MGGVRSTIARLPVAAITAGIAYFALAAVSLHLTSGVAGLATIWPSSGIFVAALLLTSTRRWLAIIACIAFASWMANGLASMGWGVATIFTLANVIEAITIVMLCQIGDDRMKFGSFDSLRHVFKFSMATIIGCTLGACIAGVLSGNANGAFFQSWATTTALGTLIVTPLVLSIAKNLTASRLQLDPRYITEAAATTAALLVLCLLVFSQSSYPLLFIPLIAVLLATYRLGATGTAIGVFCVAMVGTWAVARGTGPVILVDDIGQNRIFFFQFYLLSLLIACWPLSAVFSRLESMIQSIRRGNALLERAERTANVGHWHYEISAGELHWSDELFRIHGWDSAAKLPTYVNSMSAYHPDDRDRIRDLLIRTLKEHGAFEYDARIVRPDGEIRYVNSIGGAEFDDNGVMTGVFGMVRDVTARVAAERALEQERQSAENDARQAREQAQTDQLTGIANRRKVMMELADAITEAEGRGTPLAIGIIDIDHFKAINDNFGHVIGDDVLKQVAELCSSALREEDCIGRLGGEEFLLVMPGATTEIAMLVAERVRIAVNLADWNANDLDPVTVSIGVVAHEPGADETWLMQAADTALYRAKSEGRNLLRLAG